MSNGIWVLFFDKCDLFMFFKKQGRTHLSLPLGWETTAPGSTGVFRSHGERCGFSIAEGAVK